MGKMTTSGLSKCPTGIEGLDALTKGGFPRGRTTLLAGGTGSGKTILALQTLVNGARHFDEPGVFVAFEENPARVLANMGTLGWDLHTLAPKRLVFMDVRVKPDMVQSGAFDMMGLLAALDAKVRASGAKRVVLDALDVLLDMIDDPRLQRQELHRVHEWLLERELTAVITAKSQVGPHDPPAGETMAHMQFMVDCAMLLRHEMVQGVSQRSLQVLKYRGSGFCENQSPMVIGLGGVAVAGAKTPDNRAAKATQERISTGVSRLDTMLCGGFHRGAGVLITGSPGTAKTSLAASFANACCKRGEKSLFVSFDSEPSEIIRNMESIGLNLNRWVRQGLLSMTSARSGTASAEAQYMQIKQWCQEHKARNLVVDPVSALSKQGNQLTSQSVVERLADWTKSLGLTMLCTSLLEGGHPESEGTPIQISTIADTWIHLSYQIAGGERNRALTIVKSRGTAHSNQVREMILTGKGIQLENVYTAGGEVLLGTLRWEREKSLKAEKLRQQSEALRRLAELEEIEANLADKVNSMRRELARSRAERLSLLKSERERQEALLKGEEGVRVLRRADSPISPKKSHK